MDFISESESSDDDMLFSPLSIDFTSDERSLFKDEDFAPSMRSRKHPVKRGSRKNPHFNVSPQDKLTMKRMKFQPTLKISDSKEALLEKHESSGCKEPKTFQEEKSSCCNHPGHEVAHCFFASPTTIPIPDMLVIRDPFYGMGTEPPYSEPSLTTGEKGGRCEQLTMEKDIIAAGPDFLKTKCSFCNQEGHDVSECRYRIMIETAKANVKPPTPPPKCVMCSGQHYIQECHLAAPYIEPMLTQGENGECFYLVDGKPCPEYKPKYLEPKIKETGSKKQCFICYGEHNSICPYKSSVEKGALISPFFPVACRECDYELDKDFWCPDCKKVMIGYVGARNICEVCGKNITPNCCPYGRFTLNDFKKSHMLYKRT